MFDSTPTIMHQVPCTFPIDPSPRIQKTHALGLVGDIEEVKARAALHWMSGRSEKTSMSILRATMSPKSYVATYNGALVSLQGSPRSVKLPVFTLPLAANTSALGKKLKLIKKEHEAAEPAIITFGQIPSIRSTAGNHSCSLGFSRAGYMRSSTSIARKAGGFIHIPGIWSPKQITAFHRGASLRTLRDRRRPTSVTTDEITEYWELCATAAANANAVHKASFDGREVHRANGYLPEQFLWDTINERTDRNRNPANPPIRAIKKEETQGRRRPRKQMRNKRKNTYTIPMPRRRQSQEPRTDKYGAEPNEAVEVQHVAADCERQSGVEEKTKLSRKTLNLKERQKASKGRMEIKRKRRIERTQQNPELTHSPPGFARPSPRSANTHGPKAKSHGSRFGPRNGIWEDAEEGDGVTWTAGNRDGGEWRDNRDGKWCRLFCILANKRNGWLRRIPMHFGDGKASLADDWGSCTRTMDQTKAVDVAERREDASPSLVTRCDQT
ncbi:hypothetical protein B0H14DRAFT_2591310 [Mycena olivaceomarginata]|nr:hypothetical protein B0H14DRAFT_2591310 [Mycena olivaceomarginata]